MSKSKACWPATPAALIDIKAKVSAADTTTDFLNSKIVAGAGISKAILNPGANETLEISAPGSTTDEKVKASAGDTTAAYLDTKLAAGTNITLTKQNPGANENYLIACTAADIKAKVSANDTTTDYLNSKIVAGTGITKAILNPGANETLEISAAAAGASLNWRHTFLSVQAGKNCGAELEDLVIYDRSPVDEEYIPFHLDQNQETAQWIEWLWCAPFNWKSASGLKIWLYWFVYNEASHGTDVKFQWYIRAISDGQTLSFDQVFTNNNDVDSASDVLYITPTLSYTPDKAGAAFSPKDLFMIMVRRQNDSASGAARVLGIQIAWEIDPTIAVP